MMALPQGAELGATSDPKALIVGDKTAVAEKATAVLDEQRRIGKLLETIEGLAVPSWEGGFGKVGYITQQAQEVGRFEAYRDSLKDIGGRLNDFADALGRAQDQAQEAINKWNEGEVATKDALADHNAAVAAHNHKVDVHNAIVKTGRSVAPLQSTPPGPFNDPGDKLRHEAQQILEDARTQLDEEGIAVVNGTGRFSGGTITGTASSDGGLSSFFGGIKNAFDRGRVLGGGDGGFPGEFMKWKGDVKAGGANMPMKNPEDWSIKAGTAQFEAAAYQLKGQFNKEIGELKFNADGTVTVLGANGEAFAKIDKDGVALGAEGHLRIIEAKGEASVKHGAVELYGKGTAYVGADGVARFSADQDGVHGELDGFVGAKSAIEGGFKVGGIGLGVRGEAWTGAGVKGGFDAGLDDQGRLVVQANGGAALESGGALGADLTVDFEEVGKRAVDVAQDPRKLGDVYISPGEVRDGGEWLYSHREEIGEGARSVGEAAWENREEIARNVVDSGYRSPAELAQGTAMLVGAAYENRDVIADKFTIDHGALQGAGGKLADGVKGLFS